MKAFAKQETSLQSAVEEAVGDTLCKNGWIKEDIREPAGNDFFGDKHILVVKRVGCGTR